MHPMQLEAPHDQSPHSFKVTSSLKLDWRAIAEDIYETSESEMLTDPDVPVLSMDAIDGKQLTFYHVCNYRYNLKLI